MPRSSSLQKHQKNQLEKNSKPHYIHPAKKISNIFQNHHLKNRRPIRQMINIDPHTSVIHISDQPYQKPGRTENKRIVDFFYSF